ncbi:hypothetical protein BM613_04165 [Sulfoacidibacillus thermotolerans]|uniref:Uncharacterized protein n=1 Tax=Sulfoacidibacillus thermotolerans TaxID=1765684 RepID=A0A2U3DAX0_SULT2|nr:hypothetical protein BM613_04165 [Sulfoacidibacillus thermotolerans]
MPLRLRRLQHPRTHFYQRIATRTVETTDQANHICDHLCGEYGTIHCANCPIELFRQSLVLQEMKLQFIRQDRKKCCDNPVQKTSDCKNEQAVPTFC